MPLLSSAFSLAEKGLSSLGGRPVELYTFARGSKVWRYTSSSFPVTVEETELTYLPAKIQRGEIQRKDESGAQKVNIQLGRKMAVVEAIRDGRPLRMMVSIHRFHPSVGGLPVMMTYGDITNLQIDGSMASFDVVSSESRFGLSIPRVLITQQCQWSTYSAHCGVNSADFAHETTVVSFVRSSIVVADVGGGTDPNYYNNGIIQFADKSMLHIQVQDGTQLTLFGSVPPDLAEDDPVTIFAGDDKTFTSCKEKFDNTLHFMGFPYLPATNPLLDRGR